MIAQPRQERNSGVPPARASAEQRKIDLVALIDFGARTNRHWLVRDALLALRREGLMIESLAHVQVPTEVIDDPAPYIAEGLRGDVCWLVADGFDALRLESYGFPSLAVEAKTALTLDDLHGCRWVILLQRPGEEETLAGLDVRAELLRLGWAGTLTSITLPFTDFDEAEQECGAERFAAFLLSLLTDATSQRLAGERIKPVVREPQGTVSPTPYVRHGLRSIAAKEALAWRR